MVYRKTAKVEDQLAEKRLRILQAAQQLVVQGGFNEAPVSAIAQAADVGTGTVYRHFGSKQELLAEVVEAVSQRELEIVAAEAAAPGAPAQRLERALRLFGARALQGRRMAYALMAEPLHPDIDGIRLKYRRRLGKLYERLILEGIASGEFPAQDAGSSAACLVGACMEALVGPVSLPEDASARKREALLDHIARFALSGVRMAA